MTAIFVTATGTDVGKTFVTTGLIRHLRAAGRAADAIKPVVSGFNADDPADSDPAILLEALGRPLTDIDRICRWRFAAPLAPAMAAKREGRQDAADEGETQPDRDGTRTRLGAAAQVGAHVDGETRERGRHRCAEPRAGA